MFFRSINSLLENGQLQEICLEYVGQYGNIEFLKVILTSLSLRNFIFQSLILIGKPQFYHVNTMLNIKLRSIFKQKSFHFSFEQKFKFMIFCFFFFKHLKSKKQELLIVYINFEFFEQSFSDMFLEWLFSSFSNFKNFD